jgi:ribosome-binding factor A
MDKVNQQMKREIGTIIQQELGDPRLVFVTITAVDVSKDLRNAKVLYSVLGAEHQRNQAQQALESAKGAIRKLVGQKISMRYNPDLIFMYDQSIEHGARIEAALQEIQDDRQQKDHSNDPTA